MQQVLFPDRITQELKALVDHQFILTHKRINELIIENEMLKKKVSFLEFELDMLKAKIKSKGGDLDG